MVQGMRRNELIRRYVLFFISVVIVSGGIASITSGFIGSTPIASPNFVISLHSPLTLGMVTMLFNLLLVVLQVVMLGLSEVRKNLAELLQQVPVCMVFAPSIDLWMLLLSPNAGEVRPYVISWLLVGCGTVALGLGTALEFTANVTMIPGEYFLKVLHRFVRRSFGFMRCCFDILLVLCAVVLSLVFTGFEEIEGVREGTLFAALFTGPLVRLFTPLVAPLDKVLVAGRA